jgi:hypothetical protein
MSLIGASADDSRVVNSTTQTYCPTPIGDAVKNLEVTQTLTPNPETLNPNPETLNPNPETLNPNPETLNPKP